MNRNKTKPTKECYKVIKLLRSLMTPQIFTYTYTPIYLHTRPKLLSTLTENGYNGIYYTTCVSD